MAQVPAVPESPNAALRRELAAALRAQQFEPLPESPLQHAGTGNSDVPIDAIDPRLRDQGSSSTVPARRPHSPEPDAYRDLTPIANQMLANPNKRLKTTSTGDFLTFARSRDDVRMLMLYHALLSQQDFQHELNAKQWTIPKDLKDTISTVAYATLLSPLLTSYVARVKETILEILQANGNVPAAYSLVPPRMKAIRKMISTTATNHRAAIKKKLITSVTKKWHVGKLAKSLVAKFPDVKITSALLARLAFIRFQYANAPTDALKGDDFWKHVSAKLKEMLSLYKDAGTLANVQQGYLRRDEAHYTVGEKNKPTLVDNNGLDALQKDIDRRVGLVVIPEHDDDAEDAEDEESSDEDGDPN